MTKKKSDKKIKIQNLGAVYHGMDTDGTIVTIPQFASMALTPAKVGQLQGDFPDDWSTDIDETLGQAAKEEDVEEEESPVDPPADEEADEIPEDTTEAEKED
jgi:hypothetical protein